MPDARALAFVLAMALAMPAISLSLPLPDGVLKEYPQLRLAGEGRLRWFGLLVYDATLWADGARWDPQRAFALDLRYARDFQGHRLARTSTDEMRRLGFGSDAQLSRWNAQMEQLFPDVRKGERITGVNLPGRGVQFFHDGRPVGSVDDPEFARAFFAIWLDERTREPRLRQSLMGNR